MDIRGLHGLFQHYGPLLVIDSITAPNILGYQNGTLLLGITHMHYRDVGVSSVNSAPSTREAMHNGRPSKQPVTCRFAYLSRQQMFQVARV